MAKRKVKIVPVLVPSKKSIAVIILQIILSVLHLAFVFSSETCIYPMRWLMAMVIRGFLFYEFSLYETQFYHYFTPTKELTVWSFIFNMFICFPLMLFVLWWFLTTILMFLGALYGGFGTRNFEEEGEYSELNNFKDYLNNKARFMNYSDFLKFLQGKK